MYSFLLLLASSSAVEKVSDFVHDSDAMALDEQLGSIMGVSLPLHNDVPYEKIVQLECASTRHLVGVKGSHYFSHEASNKDDVTKFRVVECGSCGHMQFALQSTQNNNFLLAARNTHAVVQSPFSEIEDEILTAVGESDDGIFGIWTKAGSLLVCDDQGVVGQSAATNILDRPVDAVLQANEKFRFVHPGGEQHTPPPTPKPTAFCPCPEESPCRQMHDGMCRPKTNVDGQPHCTKFGDASWTLERAMQEWKYSSSNPFRQGEASSSRCYCATGTLDLFLHVCMKVPAGYGVNHDSLVVGHHRIPATPTSQPTMEPTAAVTAGGTDRDVCDKCNNGICASCHFCRGEKTGKCAFCWKASDSGRTCLHDDPAKGCDPCWDTHAPTAAPTSGLPTLKPTGVPSSSPSPAPTATPTKFPTPTPTAAPTTAPTKAPTHRPVDCVVSEWSEWGRCNLDCGGGVQKRTREVTKPALHGGKVCPIVSELQNCHTQPCPLDCSFEWGEWTACTVTCGGGVSMRPARVITGAMHGGEACPMKQMRTCSTAPCPIDCVVGAWGQYAPCSALCGGGLKERTRHILSPSKYGGKKCPSLSDALDCNTHSCPVHCSWHWLEWQPCSKSCGTGRQARTMAIMAMGEFGGTPCPRAAEQEEERVCATQACQQHDLTKVVKSAMSLIGYSAAQFTEPVQDSFMATVAATVHVDVEHVEILSFTAEQERRRLQQQTQQAVEVLDVQYTIHVQGPGQAQAVSTVLAIEASSKADAQGNLKAFTASFKMMLATVGLTPPSDLTVRALPVTLADGSTSAAVVEEAPNLCKLSAWGSWSACSEKCGGGIKRRQRTILTGRAAGLCLGEELWQLANCNEQGCPAHCQYEWEHWSPCTKTCGSGTQSRKMKILTPASNGGSPCPDAPKFLSTRTCESSPCPDASYHSVACTSEEVAGFIRTENRMAGTAMVPLAAHSLPDTTVPTTAAAMADGGDGGASECEARCGGSEQCVGFMHKRMPGKAAVCSYYAASFELGDHGRFIAYHDMYRKVCATGAPTKAPTRASERRDPVDCQVSHWSAFSRCSHPCAGGVIVRTRQTLTPAMHGGAACPPLLEVKNCNQQPCAVHCQFQWRNWGPCTKSCGGKSCPPETTSSRVCAKHPCPNPLTTAPTPAPAPTPVGASTDEHKPTFIDCTMSDWGEWDACSDECGGGVQTRKRHPKYMYTYGGKACGSVTEKRDCHTFPCPTHCTYDWGDWGHCDRACGMGLSTSHMRIVQVPLNGGMKCPSFRKRTRACNTQTCPPTQAPIPTPPPTKAPTKPDLSVAFPHSHSPTPSPTLVPTTMTPTSAPTLQPTLKFQKVTEQPTKAPTRTSATPPPTPVPIDCAVSGWYPWGPCSEDCGGGVQERKRIVMRETEHGGEKCPALKEERDCNADKPCPVHCKYEWGAWSQCSKSCGLGGVQQRVVHAIQDAQFGGLQCPKSQERTCSTAPCPTPAPTPTPTTAAAYEDEADEETAAPSKPPTAPPTLAPTPPPRRDCLVTPWSKFDACSAPCGGGVQNRTRYVAAPALSGGKPCPDLAELRNCNTKECSADDGFTSCVNTQWGAWSQCSKSCGTGVQQRQATSALRGIATKHCPKEEQRVCDEGACPTAAPRPTPAPTVYAPITLAPTASPTAPPTPDTCACAGATPCQHLSGSTCFKTIERFDYYDWKTKSYCPPDSRMCDCQCARFTPCKKLSRKTGAVVCLAQEQLYGEAVCPDDTLRCKWNEGEEKESTATAQASAQAEASAGAGVAGGVPTTTPSVAPVGFRVKAVTRTVLSLGSLSKKAFEKKVMLFLKDFAETVGVAKNEVMCKYQSDIETSQGRRLAEAKGIIVSCAVAASDYALAEDRKKTALASEFDSMFSAKIQSDLSLASGSEVKTEKVEVEPVSSPAPTLFPTTSPTTAPTDENGNAKKPAPAIVVLRGSDCVAGHCQ